MITAILGVMCFGIADALWRPNVLRYGHLKVLLYRTLLTTVLLAGFFFLNHNNQNYDLSMVCVAILSGVIAGAGLFFSEGLSIRINSKYTFFEYYHITCISIIVITVIR